jgi:probable HAF family extracellular repeat protein
MGNDLINIGHWRIKMSKTTLSVLSSILLSTALAVSATAGPTKHSPGMTGLPHYVLFDVGTFGGGLGYYSNPATRSLNRHGDSVGVSTTRIHDPFDPLCFIDCHVGHAFEWKNGGTNDLGALQYGLNSFASAINDKGLVAGISQNGKTDKSTGFFEGRAVIWKNGRIKNLGTLGGTQSSADASVNNLGQVTVTSTNADSNDPYTNVAQANCLWLVNNGLGCGQNDFAGNALFVPVSTQTHAAIWSEEGGLKDLGTLGGPDSNTYDMNDAGQVVGWSYTSYEAGPSGVPDTHPFIWDAVNGMQDLGTLGGTFAAPVLVNKSGQVTGASNLAGDTVVHPFIWDKTHGMQDIGSFGGWYSHPNWINDNGDVVGISGYPDDTRRAFYWHNGVLKDLGTIGTDDRSAALSINNKGLIVGYTFTLTGESRGFVSDGGPLVELNTLVRRPHGLYVLEAYYTNDRNEIVGIAVNKKGQVHPVVLVPETDFSLLARMNRAMKNVPQSAEPAPHVASMPRLECKKGRFVARGCAER